MMPDGWEEQSLDAVFKLASGSTKPSDVNSERSCDAPHPVYGGNGVLGYSAQSNHPGNVILIGRVGEYCGVTRRVKEPCWITDNALYAKDFFPRNDIEFITYRLQHFDVSRLRSKGGQPLVSQKPIYSTKFALPPLPEQQKIAEILSTWDRAIETTEALLATARTQKRALMQSLLTGNRRFPEFEGQEWKEVRLGDVADIRIGGTPARKEPSYWQGGTNTWLSIADLGPKYVCQSKEMITDQGVARSNVKLLPENTVVMSFKLTIGKLGITALPLYTNEAICGFVPKSDNTFNPEFLFQLLHVSDLLADVDQAVKGKTLNKAKLNELRLTLPSIEEQKRIADFLVILDEEINNTEAQIEKLRAEKKALMQQLLTGKRRVVVE